MTERFFRHAAWLVPLLLGLLSVALGQDDGWDMRNYHLYNVYALFNGRMDLDISPAGFQTYFNPALDIPYYVLTQWLPPKAVAFIFGVAHGLNFILVLAIARLMLPRDAGPRLPVLLALAGVLGAGFLAELGNSMGDNLTALLVLAPLYMLLRDWDRPTLAAAVAAGLLMGLGTGLKLTNAGFALALCIAMLLMPGAFWQRVRAAFVFGLGVLAGMAASAGWWWWEMWQRFGNPLFPQFNDIFKSPLAQPLGVLDLDHLPRGVGEALLWPFIFTRDIARIAEVPLRQLIWPVIYVLLIALAAQWLWRRLSGRGRALAPRTAFVALFFAISYLVWLKLFSIYRYLVPIELIAPLLAWLAIVHLLPSALARRAAAVAVAVCTVAAFPFTTWGHADWAEQSFSAETPALPQPGASIIFLAQADPPTAWLAQFMPPAAAVAAVGTGFPESPAYMARIARLRELRTGPHYVLFSAATNIKERSLPRKIGAAQALGMTDSAEDCARLGRWLGKVRFQVQVKPLDGGQRCTLELQEKFRIDLDALDREAEQRMAAHMARYGMALDTASCRRYRAAVGGNPYPYRLCEVRPQ